MTLGEFLKNKRIEQKLTQKELAEKLNIKTWQNIQKYEKNICEHNLKNIFKLCEILKIDIKEIKNIIMKD